MTVRRTPRRGLTTVAGIAAAGLVAAATAQTAAAEPGGQSGIDRAPQAQSEKGKLKKPQPKDKLGQHDRELLARAIDDGAKRVTVILATEKGSTASVVKGIEAAGGWISLSSDRLGYVSASVPTGKVDSLAKSAAILAVDLNESIPLPKPEADSAGTASTAAVAGPGAGTADDNPFMPTRDTGSVAFKDAHSAWDGRGVTIGIIDSGVDLDHPALQKTTTGERKIVDWVTGTHPLLEGDGSWRAMLTSVSGPTFTYAGATWTAPEGSYKVNRVSESISTNSDAAGDFNRDGDKTDVWGVLYDETTHDIWVDANQDRTFSDDEKMAPYKEKFDVGHFGTDNPDTAIAESMPFVVEYREDVDLKPAGINGTADFVNIGLVESAHGTHVAGIAAGHSLFGGEMDGQAPGAKIVSTRACSWGGGCTAVALTDGMVDLVVNRGVDVVNMSIGGLPALNDGNNARARLYDRLINDEGVQLVISAGNSGPGINTIGDPSVATDVVSVASSITKETWLSNYGSEVTTPLTLHNYSSRGPREDGGFKPNVMAPGSAISSIPTWQPGGPVPEAGYSLPPGYAMFNGTSMASPQTAGGVALLLSAAKASGLDVTPRQLRDSLYTSADFVDGVEAIGQGAGQVDVPGAWELLKASPTSQDYSVAAPVCTAISDFLATPDQGTGVYNRCDAANGGQVAGESRTYVVKVTRTSGAGGRVAHNLRLVGNDGTFSLPATSRPMPRGGTVDVPVKALTSTPGAHSAILEIDDPATAVVDHRVLLTVVLAKDLLAPSFAQTQSGTVERNLTKKMFVSVPQGAKALQVNLSGVGAGSQVRWIAYNPYGVPVESTSSLACFTNFSAPSCNSTSRAYANPLPGIWELQVEARRTSPQLVNSFALQAAAQGVTVDPASQTVASATAGQPAPVSWTVTNDFGAVSVTPKGGSLGSAVSERRTIANHEVRDFTVTVPAGAERLTATIGSPSDPGADLDLFVLNAAGTRVGQSADGDSEESVTLVNPAAGTYTIRVDGYSVPAGTTEYSYLDVFFSSALGSLTVPATSVALAPGASTPVSGEITANTAPAAGRQLFGEMRVVSSENAVLGTGSVVVGSVTP
ncbi:S8 family serine peptidase [Knoellia sp. 3-2P3]|uniref:S8 family serine peptidase n=1 Tax=unclassified Knoellia TaxID=2618719 RepID=UPI0023D97AE6|nr:S8 family serine peptidase [Knoellia sp. 3-2P3]MDF2091151.1 S8 family serine peptidase [Knoellia sp. 3-2P3]